MAYKASRSCGSTISKRSSRDEPLLASRPQFLHVFLLPWLLSPDSTQPLPFLAGLSNDGNYGEAPSNQIRTCIPRQGLGLSPQSGLTWPGELFLSVRSTRL